MDKEDIYSIHSIHNEIVFSHKKDEILPFVTTWTDLEDIPLSKSDKYHVVSFKCGIQKQKITHKNELTDTKNRLVFDKGRNGV